MNYLINFKWNVVPRYGSGSGFCCWKTRIRIRFFLEVWTNLKCFVIKHYSIFNNQVIFFNKCLNIERKSIQFFWRIRSGSKFKFDTGSAVTTFDVVRAVLSLLRYMQQYLELWIRAQRGRIRIRRQKKTDA